MAAAEGLGSETFSFTGGDPLPSDEQSRLGSDLDLFGKLSTEQSAEIADLVFDFLHDPSGQDIVAATMDLSRKIGAKESTLKNVVRSLLVVIQGAIQHSCSADSVQKDLAALGMPSAGAAKVGEVFAARASDVAHAAGSQSLSVNSLIDLSWNFGVTVSTDEVKRLGATYLQLKLVLDKGSGEAEPVFCELTLPQFYELLSELERAKAYVDLMAGAAAGEEEEEGAIGAADETGGS